MDKNKYFRRIPKVDLLIERPEVQELLARYDYDVVVEAIRDCTEELRALIADGGREDEIEARLADLIPAIRGKVESVYELTMRPVINGTGTILHTNLGRAPISAEHVQRLEEIVTGYSNLEYDLAAGQRGERYSHFEDLLCRVTGAEAAIAVNNNAAAVLLILSTLAKGGEVPVSRGELVEIGGKFRIPDVMEQSGATLVEVGTTNKTHFSDYENAITEQTTALLKVHTSNYRIVGFTESVPASELSELAARHNLPLIEDLGSGVLIDLSKYGITYEPTVQASLQNGASVVSFSGDKLLGGPQAGIVVGKKEYISRMKKNPLMRAIRIDKFTAAELELTLHEYLNEENAVKKIPVLRMMTMPWEEIDRKARRLKAALRRANVDAEVTLCTCESQIGGGSLPLERLKSSGLLIKSARLSTPELERRLRELPTPVIARVMDDHILLDMRTVAEDRLRLLTEELKNVLGEGTR